MIRRVQDPHADDEGAVKAFMTEDASPDCLESEDEDVEKANA